MVPAAEWSTYQALLAHLDRCPDCLAERSCAQADRVKRALRALRAASAKAREGGGGSGADAARGGRAEPSGGDKQEGPGR